MKSNNPMAKSSRVKENIRLQSTFDYLKARYLNTWCVARCTCGFIYNIWRVGSGTLENHQKYCTEHKLTNHELTTNDEKK